MKIDGTTQPGYSGTPLITVYGSAFASIGVGFNLVNDADGSVIQGLNITGFGVAAISVNGASNVTIGGSSPGQGNVISDNPGRGISLTAVTNPDGAPQRPQRSWSKVTKSAVPVPAKKPTVSASLSRAVTNNTVGGTITSDRNIISGNSTDGIDLVGTTTPTNTTGNVIDGNAIGTNAAGTGSVSNGNDGVNISAGATNNTVGGSAADQMNLISGNINAGIVIAGAGTSDNTIAGNFIGVDQTGNAALANGTG